MRSSDDVGYHTQRAVRELDLGLTAQSISASRAHLQLSSLHFQKARSLQGGQPASKPPFVMA